ncbi:hypothetical protein GWK08_07230 [Leptobacterium flavescens]|uniref:Tetratricopeptide repeat protein n=1 Tax=Leptobacterium flavescens TaxID=472055 RepID=A0A6P0US73_9FLAO|nr:hypothetical protein [Leptobacterium flavescens]NER13226.1 hypothetical protein [Leptobacterium flavescens]
MKKFNYIFFGCLSVFILGCSTKKDAFVNRNWHALNTKYNVLYNGSVAFEEGKKELDATYEDNYWETLPVERLKIKEQIIVPGEAQNPNFERAEEKAAKAIQKHAMNIQGRERNPQTDEAFLLLGKARYFDQRFVPALEAFNYVLYKYPDSDKIGEAKVWREKVNIRLENEELALKNLKRLLRQEKLSDQTYADATAMMGQAYINLQHKDSAITQLKIASAYTRNNEERGRYYYIIGQLYNDLGYKDSANIAFNKIIDLNRKSPRVYMINAYIEQIKNFDPEIGDKELLYETLLDLEENRENRPFLDKIYRQLALFHLEGDSIDLAVDYFNKSLRKVSKDRTLRSLNYEDVAEINFNAANYKEAGAYYDSTLTNLTKDSRRYRSIKRKRDNLEDVIKYEDVVHRNDSVLYVTSLSEAEQTAYYQKVIDDIKAKEAAEEELKEQKKQLGIAGGFGNQANLSGSDGDKFYFYNVVAVGYGKNEFRKVWGNRELEDNWRLGDKTLSTPVPQSNQYGEIPGVVTEDIYSVDTYLNQLPRDPVQLDSIKKERDFANYQLGLIYKEKFKDYDLAAEKLEAVLKQQPEEKLIIPSKYNLYKIYELTGNETKAFSVKEDIISNHSASRYAEILRNPQAVLEADSDSPDALYTKLYQTFEQQGYEEVIESSEEYIKAFNGEEIASRFELLKANALGRLEGLKAFKEALNYVALNYPNDVAGKEAQRILDQSVKKLEPKVFRDSLSREKWKLVFPFRKKDTASINKLYKTVDKALTDLRYDELSLSKDVYNKEQLFVVVHGLLTKDRALGFAELLKINKDYKIDNENFVILSPNYRIVQIHKNLEEYLNSNNSLKP